jgi:hypothetical protein
VRLERGRGASRAVQTWLWTLIAVRGTYSVMKIVNLFRQQWMVQSLGGFMKTYEIYTRIIVYLSIEIIASKGLEAPPSM